jgi:gamma-glutamylcysteine synthetase
LIPPASAIPILSDKKGPGKTPGEPLECILELGRTPAEGMLDKFNGEWGGSVEPAYQEYAF